MTNHPAFDWYHKRKKELLYQDLKNEIPTLDVELRTKLAGQQVLKYHALVMYASEQNIGTDELLKEIFNTGVHHVFRFYRDKSIT